MKIWFLTWGDLDAVLLEKRGCRLAVPVLAAVLSEGSSSWAEFRMHTRKSKKKHTE